MCSLCSQSALGVIFLYERDDKCVFITTGSELDDGKEALKLLQYIISINLRIYKVYNTIFERFRLPEEEKTSTVMQNTDIERKSTLLIALET